jgi:hypothetical protein
MPTSTCAQKPTDLRAFGKAVGDDLIKHHGKHPYYSVKQIRRSVKRLDFPLDWDCWAYALYSSPADFEAQHAATGEVCDYAAMKSEMFSAMTDGASSSWFDLDMSWLEWPDIDFSSIFDSIDF